MTDYTPSLEEVKAAYRYDRTGKAIRLDDCSDPSIINADHSFDRMIAQVRQEAKVQALREAAKSLHDDDTAEYASAKYMRHIIYATWLEERADQIEQEHNVGN